MLTLVKTDDTAKKLLLDGSRIGRESRQVRRLRFGVIQGFLPSVLERNRRLVKDGTTVCIDHSRVPQLGYGQLAPEPMTLATTS